MSQSVSETNALNINWTFGFSKDIHGSVQSLNGGNNYRNALLFLASHSAIIYNYELKTQVILQVADFLINIPFYHVIVQSFYS